MVPVVYGAGHVACTCSMHSRTQRNPFCPAVTNSGKHPITWPTLYGRYAWKLAVMAREACRQEPESMLPVQACGAGVCWLTHPTCPLAPDLLGLQQRDAMETQETCTQVGREGARCTTPSWRTVIRLSTCFHIHLVHFSPVRTPRSTTYSRLHVPSSAGPGTVSAQCKGVYTPFYRHAVTAPQLASLKCVVCFASQSSTQTSTSAPLSTAYLAPRGSHRKTGPRYAPALAADSVLPYGYLQKGSGANPQRWYSEAVRTPPARGACRRTTGTTCITTTTHTCHS